MDTSAARATSSSSPLATGEPELSASELNKRRMALNRARREQRSKHPSPTHRSDSGWYYQAVVVEPIDAVVHQLAVVNHHLSEVKRAIATLAHSDVAASETGAAPAPMPGKDKVKGKNIDAKMMNHLAKNLDTVDWSSKEWAHFLRCAESTVRETRTWKERLAVARKLFAADRAKSMDHSHRFKRGRRLDEASDER